MRIILLLSVFGLCFQQPGYADEIGYLRARIELVKRNGPWENDAQIVIQIGTFRDEKSTTIDSIVKKKDGELILIRDEIRWKSKESPEWQIFRKSINRMGALDDKVLAALTDIAPLEQLQFQVRSDNSSQITQLQRFLHVYTQEGKWRFYELAKSPEASDFLKIYQDWEKNFGRLFQPLLDVPNRLPSDLGKE